MRNAIRETVLITGASSGIGLELARQFAASYASGVGGHLILVARNRPSLDALAVELSKDHGVQVTVLTVDLAASETPNKLFSELAVQNISVDVLVNNAGFGAIGAFAQLPLSRQMEMLQVNVAALTELTRLFLPGMIRHRNGGILNVASVAGFVPGPGMAVYYATKAFVLSFTEALAGELDGTGVKVSSLCPGPTATNFGNVAGSKNVEMIRIPSMSAAAVARIGYQAFRRGRVVSIPGWQNKLLMFVVKFTPRALVRKITRKFNGFWSYVPE